MTYLASNLSKVHRKPTTNSIAILSYFHLGMGILWVTSLSFRYLYLLKIKMMRYKIYYEPIRSTLPIMLPQIKIHLCSSWVNRVPQIMCLFYDQPSQNTYSRHTNITIYHQNSSIILNGLIGSPLNILFGILHKFPSSNYWALIYSNKYGWPHIHVSQNPTKFQNISLTKLFAKDQTSISKTSSPTYNKAKLTILTSFDSRHPPLYWP